MISEVMKEIEQAEAKAEEIISAAWERARNISQSARAEVEDIRKEYDARLKEELDKIEKRAEKEGNEQANEILKKAKTEADDVAKANERDFGKCVGKIADRISKA